MVVLTDASFEVTLEENLSAYTLALETMFVWASREQ